MRASQDHYRGRAGLPLVAAILALAIANAFLGMVSLPLDSHEVFVVQTAQEMHDRGSWVIPYFNEVPRLTKPPLSYWLTGIVAALTPGPFEVQPWQGRLPSALAGILLVLLTARLGRLLFGPTEGWLAAAIVASSSGYLTYTHSARPEMLYAMLCTGAILCFAGAWKSEDNPRRRQVWGLCQWLCFGLATLAKGPHVPALLLAGAVLFLATRRTKWKECFRILQPLSGLVLGIGIPLAWFLLVNRGLRESGANGLTDSQLSGTLYRFDWREALIPYYAATYPLLFIPWLALFPFLPWLRRPAFDSPSKLLMLLIVATLFPLNFAVQRHGYYALPLLAPGAVLLATAAIHATKAFAERGTIPPWWTWAAWIHVPLTLALLAYAASGLNTKGVIFVVTLSVTLAACLAIAGRAQSTIAPPAYPLFVIAACLGVVSLTLTATQLSWSQARTDRVHTALRAKQFVDASTTLIAMGPSDELLLYYTKRKVVLCNSRDALIDVLRKAPGQSAVLVIDRDKLGLLSVPIISSELGGPAPGDECVLSVRLEESASAQ